MSLGKRMNSFVPIGQFQGFFPPASTPQSSRTYFKLLEIVKRKEEHSLVPHIIGYFELWNFCFSFHSKQSTKCKGLLRMKDKCGWIWENVTETIKRTGFKKTRDDNWCHIWSFIDWT